jgi:ABC-2 type transport system permease protein
MLFNPARNYRNFLLPGMLAALIQVGIVCMGAERAGEMRDSRIAFPAHIKTIFYWGVLGSVSIFLTLLEQYLLFGIPYKGTLLGGIVVTLLFSTVVLGMGYIVGSVISDRVLASQISAVVVLPTTILGGYTWPTLAMPAFFQQLAKILPFYYYGEAVRDLCLKPLQFHHLHTEIFALCVFAAVEAGVLYLIKRKGVVV